MPDNQSVHYEWVDTDKRNQGAIASGRRLRFADVSMSDSGRYICVVRSPLTDETAESDPVILRVNKRTA